MEEKYISSDAFTKFKEDITTIAHQILIHKQHLVYKYTQDRYLKSFLVARENNIERAKEMWVNSTKWRLNNKVDDISANDCINEVQNGLAFLFGHDIKKNPCVVVKLKNYKPGSKTNDEKMNFFVFILERAIAKSEKNGTGQISVIWDRQGFGREQFDSNFINLLKQILKLFQENYAQRLHALYLPFPSIIVNIAYAIFKPFMAQRIIDQIQILDRLQQLHEYFNKDQLLVQYGGTCNYIYDPNKMLENDASYTNINDSDNQDGDSQFFSLENNSEAFFNQTIDENEFQSPEQENNSVSFFMNPGGYNDNGNDYRPEFQQQKNVMYETEVQSPSGCCGCDGSSKCIIF